MFLVSDKTLFFYFIEFHFRDNFFYLEMLRQEYLNLKQLINPLLLNLNLVLARLNLNLCLENLFLVLNLYIFSPRFETDYKIAITVFSTCVIPPGPPLPSQKYYARINLNLCLKIALA